MSEKAREVDVISVKYVNTHGVLSCINILQL